jgi:poly(A) polymerase
MNPAATDESEHEQVRRGLASLLPVLEPVARRFAESGYHLYLVGGIVRDLLVTGSATDADVDLTTDAEPGAIKDLTAPSATALWTQGERFGTIGARVGDRDVEITTHRGEHYDPESRKPVVSFGHELREDLSRRDFTVNAMAIELPSLDLLDPFDGRGDLESRVLRTPLSPQISFTDDPLRMLRAARFMSRLVLTPTDELTEAATAMSDRLAIVSVERVADELERLLSVADPGAGFRFLQRTGLLDQVVLDLPDGSHDLAVALASAPSDGETDQDTARDTALVRRAGLLWPVADVARALSRLRYSNADRKVTVDLVESVRWWIDGQHSSAADGRRLLDRVGGEQVGAVERFARRLGPVLEAELGDTGGAAACRRLLDALDRLTAMGDVGPYEPLLSGQEIMDQLGLAPGPEIGRVQRLLKQHHLDHGPMTVEEARDVIERLLPDRTPGSRPTP